MKRFFAQQNRGYTLLFAVLVASLALAVGISILNLSKKEFLIATSARDSEAAIYAADGGLECGIYANDQQVFDKTKTQIQLNDALTQNCKMPQSDLSYSASGGQDIFVFHVETGGEGKSCAIVTVTKWTDVVNGNQVQKTNIQSRGYNTGWDDGASTCSKSSAKKVERGLSYNVF